MSSSRLESDFNPRNWPLIIGKQETIQKPASRICVAAASPEYRDGVSIPGSADGSPSALPGEPYFKLNGG